MSRVKLTNLPTKLQVNFLTRGYTTFIMVSKKKSVLKSDTPPIFRSVLVLLSGLFVTYGFLASQAFLFKKPEIVSKENDPTPQRVKISNITDQGFTVSWISTKPSLGAVVFSRSKIDSEPLDQNINIAFDQRGEFVSSKSHFINLSNLKADTAYYFLIKSGSILFFRTLGGEWKEKGLSAEQITGPKNFQPQNLLQGQILTKSGQAEPETFVFLEIPGRSSLLAAITDSRGEWQIDLAKLTYKDSRQPLKYLPGNDLFRLTAETTSGEIISSYQPAPLLPSGQIIINLN